MEAVRSSMGGEGMARTSPLSHIFNLQNVVNFTQLGLRPISHEPLVMTPYPWIEATDRKRRKYETSGF